MMSPATTPACTTDVLIAWDASGRTVAALDAFLARAEDGHLILAEVARNDGPSAEDAVAWLVAHGRTAQVHRPARPDRPSAILQKICEVAQPRYCLTNGLCRCPWLRPVPGLATPDPRPIAGSSTRASHGR